jgi:hypothetical protein
MREGRGVVDVPAVTVFGGLRVDEDESELLGGGGQFGAAVPLLGCAAAGVELRENGLATVDVYRHESRLTATTIAGFAAILAGTEMYIWMFDGLEPKPVTCWRAPKAELAEANKANAVVKAFMLMIYL